MIGEKHGHASVVKNGKKHFMYNSWVAMRQRCANKNHKNYVDYGARGITVCDRWKSFLNFLEDMGERPEGMTLDRIDNSKGYSPDNCVWSNQRRQVLNSRNRKNKRSIYRGVGKRSENMWIAKCNHLYLGSFRTEREAAIAYNVAAIEQFGELATINILE